MIKGYALKEHQERKLIINPVLEERIGLGVKINRESVQVLNESAGSKKRKLIVTMEAIHVGRTANFTYYTKEGLTAGLESWTHPYSKPVLTHHNDWNGEPVGRILKAEWSEMTASGRPGLIFTCEITDPDAVEKVLDGRYQTVSIGATTDKVVCNICGTDRVQEYCEHWPGDTYDEQTCHFIVGTTMGKEVSYVNTPADQNAGNIHVEAVDPEQDPASNTQESYQYLQIFQVAEGLFQDLNNPGVNLYESLNESQKTLINKLAELTEGGQKIMDDDDEANNNNNPTPVPVIEGANLPNGGQVLVQESELQAQLKEANDKINLLNGTIATIVTEKQQLETKITEMTTSHDDLLAENTRLNEELHKNLAEKVVDLKRSMNKPDVVGIEREESIQSHITRTKESLENTLADLLAESKNFRPVPGSVTNPGLAEGDNAGGEKKEYTLAEADNIIKSMFKRK